MSRGEGLRWNLDGDRSSEYGTEGEKLLGRGLLRAPIGGKFLYAPGQIEVRVETIEALPDVLVGFVTGVGRDGSARILIYLRALVEGAASPDGEILPTGRWIPEHEFRAGVAGRTVQRPLGGPRAQTPSAHEELLERARAGRT